MKGDERLRRLVALKTALDEAITFLCIDLMCSGTLGVVRRKAVPHKREAGPKVFVVWG
jgi:hypothetical protein